MTDEIELPETSQEQDPIYMLGANVLQDGDEFRDDGWVYNNERRCRKWFGNLNAQGIRARIWEPKLKCLEMLEAKRWKGVQYLKGYYKGEWNAAYEAITSLGGEKIVDNCQITHKHKSDKEWWLYKFSLTKSPFTLNDTYAWTFDWVDKPEHPIHLELGQKFYEVDQHSRTIAKRKGIFLEAFNVAMNDWLREHNELRAIPGKTLKVNINGRSYWFHPEPWGDDYKWVKMLWPDEDLIEVTLGDNNA